MKRTFILLSVVLAGAWAYAQSPVQIGSASNGYSTYLSGEHCLWLHSRTGTNGGSLSFVHRENTSIHTGAGASSGRIRYAISTDGGANWSTEQGTITPANTFLSRYPAGVLFNPDSTSTNTNDLKLALVCPTLNATPAFEGHLMGLVDSVATSGFVVRQEEYLYRTPNAKSRIPRSVVERVPGEFFYPCFANNVRDIDIYKGVYNSAQQRIDWTLDTTLSPNYALGNQQPQGLQMAFDPTGTTGYIAYVGDLAGGFDGVYSPIFIKTTDGGATWGAAEEINMTEFPDLVDSLTYTPTSTGIPNTGSIYPSGVVIPNSTDLTVDADGRPHFVVLVGNTISNVPAFNLASGKFLVVDFTQDQFGIYIGKYVASKATRRGTFGDPTVTNGTLLVETWMQVTRSPDGSALFYSWTETDTSAAGWNFLLDNNAPNLLGRGYDLKTDLMTPIVNWTINDTVWSGRVLTPTVATEVFQSGNDFTVPTMAMRFQTNGTSALMPVSYWYFPQITYNSNSFTDTTVCFINCRSTLASSVAVNVVDETCGNMNGSITLTPNFTPQNPGPFFYNWSNGSINASINNLPGGTYTVSILDSLGCTIDQTYTVAAQAGPAIDSVGFTDASCPSGTDGSASVAASGGAGGLTYAWITGDTTTSISGVPAGGYLVSVTDANGCMVDTTIFVGEPPAITILTNSTMPTCFGGSDGTAGSVVSGGTPGYTYLWNTGDTTSNANGLASGLYSVVITDANGCTQSAMAQVTDPPDIMLSPSSFNVSCFGGIDGSAVVAVSGGTMPYFFQWSNGTVAQNLTNVGAGTYIVDVTDANGCMKQDSVVITQPDAVTATDSAMDISCNGAMDGSITLDVSGGTPPYTYTWTNGQNTKDITGLGPGTYAVSIQDANGCSGNTIAMIAEPPRLSTSVSTTPDDGTGTGSATVTVSGGMPPYMYQWNGGQTTATLSNLFAGNYIVTVTDANGCTEMDTVVVPFGVGIDDLLQAGISEVRIFPNPNNGEFFVALDLHIPSPLRAELLSIEGKQLRVFQYQRARSHSFAIREKELAAGMYLISLSTESGRIYRRILIE